MRCSGDGCAGAWVNSFNCAATKCHKVSQSAKRDKVSWSPLHLHPHTFARLMMDGDGSGQSEEVKDDCARRGLHSVMTRVDISLQFIGSRSQIECRLTRIKCVAPC